jgi:hypothetical protein
MARTLILAVAALVLAPMPSRADTAGAQQMDGYLARGKKLFDDQEYAAAIQALAPVTRDARATRAQRLRALELIALANYIRGEEGAARSTFERILDIDPGYQLQDTSGSPKIREFFAKLKAQLVPNYDPNAGADLEHAAPTAGTAGRPLEFQVRVTRGNVFDVVVATRRRGELSYKTKVLAPRGENRWRVHVTPDPSPKPYVLEYYLEARDAGGGQVARIAGPDQPLDIAVAAGGREPQPWYTHWYVIAGAAALATGATVIGVEANRGPGPGTLPPGSIVVTH